jgi:hypothetical protein
MNSFHLSMRTLTTVALILICSISVALAGAPVSGKVTGVNQNTHTFTVQWVHKYTDRHNIAKENSHESTFNTTNKTIYTVGSNKGSWTDLKKGEHVTVTANAGVADNVQIASGS